MKCWTKKYTMPNGEEIDINIRQSRRKHVVVEVTLDARVFVRIDNHTPEEVIDAVLEESKEQIQEHVLLNRTDDRFYGITPLTKEDIERLGERAQKELQPRLNAWQKRLGLYLRPTLCPFVSRTKFGEFHPPSLIRFNVLMLYAPDYVQEYCLIHELAHYFVSEHNKDFWKKVEELMPDYRKAQAWISYNRDFIRTLAIF